MGEKIFDSHAHYDSGAFDDDRYELIDSLFDGDVCGIINCASDIDSARFSLSLADRYPGVYAAVGVHPQEVLSAGEFDEEQLKALLSHKKAVAVGEIGLEYHYDCAPKQLQLDWFERQLELAVGLDMPVIVHDRDAHADTMRLLKKYRPKGVVHCFSGSVEMMKETVALGLYIGLGGAVTFKNARVPVEVAQAVPIDRLLLETDCPYMTPVPHRGERNDSSFIRFVAQRIAEVRGIAADEVIKITADNAKRIFGIY